MLLHNQVYVGQVGQAGPGLARSGQARPGLRRPGLVRPGHVWSGHARLGQAWPVLAWTGHTWLWPSLVWPDLACPGHSRPCLARLDLASQDLTCFVKLFCNGGFGTLEQNCDHHISCASELLALVPCVCVCVSPLQRGCMRLPLYLNIPHPKSCRLVSRKVSKTRERLSSSLRKFR